ncbi:fumarylacetoacetate hydrolase family protein [Aneurinibacillus sp. BA2021]|nr:fumarylacetoacetate hydrolase family protein [Aneurinibacillus sp. BA2021]
MNLASGGELPSDMSEFLQRQEVYMPRVMELQRTIAAPDYKLADTTLLAPLPRPSSVRDFMAFELHVKNAYEKIGKAVPVEWYSFPVFYFTNHQTIIGPAQDVQRPPHTAWLDYELEIACVIGKEGRNIKAAEAEEYIFGYTIFNDWSARDLQMKELPVGLGPAKGKDFASSLGPYLVTKDELEPYRVGDRFDLDMTASVNGRMLSRGNAKDMHYTFGDMIERASDGVTLYPGDVIASGTVGTGCILELGAGVQDWLQPGDTVELAVTGLGRLKNTVV